MAPTDVACCSLCCDCCCAAVFLCTSVAGGETAVTALYREWYCLYSYILYCTCFLMRSETSSVSSGTAFLFGLKSSSESSSSSPSFPLAKPRCCCCCVCWCGEATTDHAPRVLGNTIIACRRSWCWCWCSAGEGLMKEASERRGAAVLGVVVLLSFALERASARTTPWRAVEQDIAMVFSALLL